MAVAPKKTKTDPAANMLKGPKRGAGDPNYVKKMTESAPKKPTTKPTVKPKAPVTKPTAKPKPKPKQYKDATDRPGFLYGKGTV